MPRIMEWHEIEWHSTARHDMGHQAWHGMAHHGMTKWLSGMGRCDNKNSYTIVDNNPHKPPDESASSSLSEAVARFCLDNFSFLYRATLERIGDNNIIATQCNS